MGARSLRRPSSTRLLAIARWGVLTTLALVLVLIAAGIPTMLREASSACTGAACYRWEPAPRVAERLATYGLSLHVYAAYTVTLQSLFTVALCFLAVVMVLRRPDEPMALFGAFTLVTFGTAFSDPGEAAALSSPIWWWVRTVLAMSGWASLFVFFYVFPDGRFVPRWTRVAAVLWSALMAVSFLTAADWGTNNASAVLRTAPDNNSALGQAFGVALILFFVSVITAQVYRYLKVSGPIQRQQTKWVIWGFVGTFGGLILLVGILGASINNALATSSLLNLLGPALFELVLFFLPLSFVVAILRYRLWDVDVLINRTLVYGSLTVSLGLLYVFGVVVLQSAFRAMTGQGSGLAVAISTLAIAALFQPLRRRIQSFIDRRFYRRKYDATRTLSRFGERLRDDVDLDQLTSDVLSVVQETMQPAHVSLWLRRESRS